MKITIEDATMRDSIVLRTLRPFNGIGLFLISSEGWFGTPAPREEPVERFLTDGDLNPSTLSQGARVASFHGHGRFDSSIDAADFMDKVNGLFGRKLNVIEDGPNGQRAVHGAFLSADPEFEMHEGTKVIDFDLILTCPDPLKYGRALTVSLANGNNTIMVEGNAPTWPTFIAQGQASSLTASCGGQEVKWTGSIGGKELDFKTMQPTGGSVAKDNAFTLKPGQNIVNVQSDGSVKLRFMPAWR